MVAQCCLLVSKGLFCYQQREVQKFEGKACYEIPFGDVYSALKCMCLQTLATFYQTAKGRDPEKDKMPQFEIHDTGWNIILYYIMYIYIAVLKTESTFFYYVNFHGCEKWYFKLEGTFLTKDSNFHI
jgi:hypothetical protein